MLIFRVAVVALVWVSTVAAQPPAGSSGVSHRGLEASSCTKCHADLTAGRKYVHEAVPLGCTVCHDPQRQEIANMLRAPVNDLCLECHGAGPREGETATLFHGKVRIPAAALRNMRPLPVRAGHPVPYHPVYVPGGLGQPEINCLSCHVPHASDGSPKLLVSGAEGRKGLCGRCHSHE